MAMKSREEYVGELLGGGVPVTVKVPIGLYEKLVELARRRYGNLPKDELVIRSLPYAAALGTLSWSLSYRKKSGPRKARAPKAEEKK